MKDLEVTTALRWKTFAGVELDRITFPAGEHGYASTYQIYQPVLEQTLRDGAARFGNVVSIRYGEEVTSLEQDADGVSVSTKDLATGAVTTLRARYVLACDGGSSGIREQLGVKMLGDTIDTKWVIIDAFVKRWWPDRNLLTFWSDPKRPVVDIALSLGTHRWELPLQAHETESDFTTKEQLWSLLKPIGVSEDDVEIHQHAFYKHHVRHAERWRIDRVFLLGDAAHLMPPWAGQGMQSGMRDSFNLSWKLAEVLAGRLPDAVLDTYEIERAPDVAKYTAISVQFGRLVKMELSEEELAAQRPDPDAPPASLPLMALASYPTGWFTGKIDEGSAVGKMIPQPFVMTAKARQVRLDDLLGPDFVVLGASVDPATVMSAEQKAAWDNLGATYHVIRAPDEHSSASTDIIDIHRTLLDWMAAHGVRVIALRPDRFVAAADATGLDVPGRS